MLDKLALNQVISDWSFREKPAPATLSRRVLDNLPALQEDLVLAITGVRRCGKSTLLHQIMQSKKLETKRCYFLNFEDPRLSEHLNFGLLEETVSLAHEEFPTGPKYFFFDEIQNIQDWQKWLHQKLAKPQKNFFVITGSNSSLLSGDLGSKLTGRHLSVELFPFDYSEFRVLRPKSNLEEYLESGGFPRVLTFDSPQVLLREYFTDIIERDIRSRIDIRSTLALNQLVKIVFESMGSETSQRNLANALKISADTVGTYLEACESAYIVQSCPYFTYSEKQRLARQKKYYPIDLGLRGAVATQTGMDLGKKLETAIFLALRRKCGEVFYWRETKEVDFVVRSPEGITPYQVTWEKLKERHVNGLSEFKKAFPDSLPGVVVTRANAEEMLT
ncbi:MAG: ATP-binding protein [Deltaproteobacteria bacterium]|nr:ATP-binding protein [Deltaproteobacteria bacterium]